MVVVVVLLVLKMVVLVDEQIFDEIVDIVLGLLQSSGSSKLVVVVLHCVITEVASGIRDGFGDSSGLRTVAVVTSNSCCFSSSTGVRSNIPKKSSVLLLSCCIGVAGIELNVRGSRS